MNLIMLIQSDFDQIKRLVGDKLQERTRNLPTKNDFFTKMDEVMLELKAIRENTKH